LLAERASGTTSAGSTPMDAPVRIRSGDSRGPYHPQPVGSDSDAGVCERSSSFGLTVRLGSDERMCYIRDSKAWSLTARH